LPKKYHDVQRQPKASEYRKIKQLFDDVRGKRLPKRIKALCEEV